MELALILHDIRSAHNVGSLFRTADAAGVSKIILSGYTPSPLDRFGRARSDIAKVALGAEKSMLWKQIPELATTIEGLKQKGFLVLALEQHPDSISLFDFAIPNTKEKVALILGSEVGGLSPEILGLADHILEIPMRGNKESLNVAVAAGIALYALLAS
ncbi:MAG: TrmH family RNA methyltransferase [Minisyncoccia bacterium]